MLIGSAFVCGLKQPEQSRFQHGHTSLVLRKLAYVPAAGHVVRGRRYRSAGRDPQ
jgi:hypothetical protein